jgi:lantibiotic modifying enzyme
MLMSIRDAALARGKRINTVAGQRQQSLRPAPDMYSGTEGLALFLGYVGSVLRDKEATECARTLITHQRERSSVREFPIGAFIGIGASIYLYSHMATVWNDGSLLQAAEDLVDELIQREYVGIARDVMRGASGLILALESIYRLTQNGKIVALVSALADELVRTAVPQKTGAGWPFGQKLAIATGFAHGTAGCAASLCLAHELTGEAKYLRLAEAAFDFESSLFVEEWSNWPHTEEHPDLTYPYINASWCWGAGGIALSRLRVKSSLLSSQSLADARRALFATVAYGFSGRPQCLCHGRGGSVDILREASQVLGEPLWTNIAQIQSAYLETAIVQNGLCCEMEGHDVKNTSSLMTGFLGVGYVLLRSLAPTRVPCVLSLSPPLR